MPKYNAADTTATLPRSAVANSLKLWHKGRALPLIAVGRAARKKGSRLSPILALRVAVKREGPVPALTGPGLNSDIERCTSLHVLNDQKGKSLMRERCHLRVVSSSVNNPPRQLSPEFVEWLASVRAMSSATYKPQLHLLDTSWSLTLHANPKMKRHRAARYWKRANGGFWDRATVRPYHGGEQ